MPRNQKRNASDKKTSSLGSAKKWIKTAAMVAVYLLFLTGSFFFVSRYKPVQDFLGSLKKNKTPSRAHIVNQIPKKRTYKPGELVLNGTSLIDGRRVALINDEIYEIGEVIDGKKITSINLNKIELSDNETVVTLRVH